MTLKQHIKWAIKGILLALIISTTVAWWYTFWPFTKGSDIPAFLGTTFEMTLPEVQRALNKSGIQLIDKESFKKNHPDISKISSLFIDFTPMIVLTEDSPKNDSWYLPPLEMFSSYVIGEFNFNTDRLVSVYLQVHPFKNLLSETSLAKANEEVIREIVSSLEKKNYKSVKTEPSIAIPGAYDQYFEGKKTKVNLWVDLTDPKDPIINIYIIYTKPNEIRKKIIEKRENNAF